MFKNIIKSLIFKVQKFWHYQVTRRQENRAEDRIIDHKLRALVDRTLLDRILEGNRD